MNLLASVRASDIVNSNQVNTIQADASVSDGCSILFENGLSAPVVKEGKFVGMLDLKDLLAHTLQLLQEKVDDFGSSQSMLSLTSSQDTIGSILRSKRLVKCGPQASLSEVIKLFEQNAVQKVLVIDDITGSILGSVTTLAVAARIVDSLGIRGSGKWEFGMQALSDCNVIETDIVSVDSTCSVRDTFTLINESNVSSCAIIEHNKLLGSLSMTDFEFILTAKAGWKHLNHSSFEFFKHLRNSQVLSSNEATVPNFSVYPSTPLIVAMEKMVTTRTHRIWIVCPTTDDVLGLVSLSEILKVL